MIRFAAPCTTLLLIIGCTHTSTKRHYETGWKTLTTSKYSARSDPAQRTSLNEDQLLAKDVVKIGELSYRSDERVEEAELVRELEVKAAREGAELFNFRRYTGKGRVTESTTEMVDYSSRNAMGYSTFTYQTQTRDYEVALYNYTAHLYRRDPEAAVHVRAAVEAKRHAAALYERAHQAFADPAK